MQLQSCFTAALHLCSTWQHLEGQILFSWVWSSLLLEIPVGITAQEE